MGGRAIRVAPLAQDLPAHHTAIPGGPVLSQEPLGSAGCRTEHSIHALDDSTYR